MIESEIRLGGIGRLVKQLVIGVNEAIAFGDMEILEELEIKINDAISVY